MCCLLDINDFSPSVSLTESSVTRQENTAVGDLLSTATAVDNDPANTANSRVSYSIATVNPVSGLNLFYINPINGGIYLGQPFSSDTNGFTSYVVTVQATDFGTPALSGTAVLNVNVLRNTQAPVFVSLSFSASVAQTLSVGSSVVRVSAEDADSQAPFNVITYSIIGNGNAPSFFQLENPSNGLVTVRDTLTKDSALSYSLVIVATDGGGTSATATATIVVQRNLNDPQFSQLSYTRTIEENFPLATSVVQILATDNDILSPHNQLQYTIVGDNDALDYFTISESGLITLKRSPASSQLNTFTITVALRDRGLPASRAASNNAVVTVNILRNENPPIFFNTTFSAQILESVSVGTSVIRVTASDSDVNPQFNQISYSVIGDDTAPSYFDINSVSGDVITSARLTTENVNVYRVRVLATDNGFPARSATAIVVVTVLRNFVSPVWPQSTYSTNVLETQSLGVPIITVTANDNDFTSPNNLVYYQLTGNTEAQNYFQVDRLTGQISVRTSLTTDANNPTTYTLRIRAEDGGTPSRTSTVDVTVLVNVIRNVNGPQFINSAITREVSQNAQVGNQIVQVTAVDADGQGSFGVITYSIVGVDTAPTFFTIDPQTGSITLSRSLATDTLTEYRLLIQAADNGYPAKTDLAVVTVLVNRNLNSPVFLPTVYNVTILDNSNLGDVIVTVTATDSDFIAPNNVVRYSGISTARALDLFFINSVTGAVSVRRPLTDDSGAGNNLYTLTISAQDQGVPTSLIASQPATVFINVIRNQFGPVFRNTPYSVEISQNTGLFASIFTVSALDNDLQAPYNTVTYSVIGDDVAPSFFAVNPSTGVVSVTRSLLGDSTSSYRVSIASYFPI
ncbi:cadherin EGF LAG seven-pass G-type receptor 1-like [Babylonia areolata]|uniref:cadherin EGF LAG seven-pass G-type receptor 1-like n=1 Tax=Babylonia areolata TaxID=304850 RepID=UPI003FD52451